MAPSTGVPPLVSMSACLGPAAVTVESPRGGMHRELILARLHEALARGADLATASTLPGSGSQRNYERAGFRVAYTKVTLVG